jgi:hypothetical protein
MFNGFFFLLATGYKKARRKDSPAQLPANLDSRKCLENFKTDYANVAAVASFLEPSASSVGVAYDPRRDR